ncbi:aminoacyl-tRNA hydrolase [Trueperella sp. LYQ143]|uniref:aminoacyl-tRNA hydrolase n=1 Tax=unclassified Trueperella TaxID=2630174 RepID=UPI0039835B4B
MYAVVGLGNTGAQYEATRHNIGQHVIHALATRAGTSLSLHKPSQTRAASVLYGVAPGNPGQRLILGITNGYMNTSGGPIKSLMSYFKIPTENLIVVHDELDLPFGVLKLKRGGGEGGHNGLRSLSGALGTKNYIRLRFGIGRPPAGRDAADYVLSNFTTSERRELDMLIDAAVDAVEDVLMRGLDSAQLRLHSTAARS